MTGTAALAADTGDVVVPVAIIVGCLVVIVVSIVVRRRRGDPGASNVERWQTTHGRSVDLWLDAHEGSLASLSEGDDPALERELVKAMEAATAGAPDVSLRELLRDMQATATATREAITEGNRLAAESAHVAYRNHRQGAIFRIQQLERSTTQVDEPAPRS